MSKLTKIQWSDSTVKPTMGCFGCELFPTPTHVIGYRIGKTVLFSLSEVLATIKKGGVQ